MTQAEQQIQRRDTLVKNLQDAVIELSACLESPTNSELYDIEMERDRLSQLLDKYKERKAA